MSSPIFVATYAFSRIYCDREEYLLIAGEKWVLGREVEPALQPVVLPVRVPVDRAPVARGPG